MNAWINKLSWWTIMHLVCVFVNIWSFTVTNGNYIALFGIVFCGWMFGMNYKKDMENAKDNE